MINDVPDRVWIYASNIETWRGVGEWTDDAEPDCSDEWPHAPFLRATSARLHAEELVEALRFYGDAKNWKGDPEAWERVEAGDDDPETLDATLSDVEIDGGKRARDILARIEQETTHGKEPAND